MFSFSSQLFLHLKYGQIYSLLRKNGKLTTHTHKQIHSLKTFGLIQYKLCFMKSGGRGLYSGHSEVLLSRKGTVETHYSVCCKVLPAQHSFPAVYYCLGIVRLSSVNSWGFWELLKISHKTFKWNNEAS